MPNWKKLITSGSAATLSNLNVTNAVTASTYLGDGSALTGITVAQTATVSQTFSNQTSVAVDHNFNTRNVIIQTFDDNNAQVIPASVTLTSVTRATITFDSSTSGRVVVAKGGHIVSGVNVAQNATITDTFSSQTSVATSHNFDTKNVLVTVYDSNDAQIIPASVTTTDTNIVTTTYDSSTSGRVVVAKGGHLVSGSLSYSQLSGTPSGIISSSAQIDSNFFDIDGLVSSSTQIITLVGVDEDNMSSDSTTKFPTQQSVKAYIATQIDTKDALSELSGNTDDVSEGSSNFYYTDARVKTKLDADGVVSGSIINSQLANDSVTYVAGDGLTGGGITALGNSATINVVGGDGITANANEIIVDSTILRTGGVGVISGSSQIESHLLDNSVTFGTGTITAALTDSPIKETRAGTGLSFWQGTQAQYDALGSYGSTTIYLVE
jgi:drug/metabolite transporter superfamily protein YnfA